jgi:ABC-type sugar transport system substrate-binding protein
VGPAPIYQYYISNAKIAAAKLGWTIKPFVYQTSATGAMQAAISSKVSAIWGVSLVKQSIAPQLAAAKAAGIPVFNMGTPEASQPSNLYFTMSHDNDEIVHEMTDWIINDSKGTANIALVDLPEIPYFVPSTNEMKATLKSSCPKCTFNDVPISLQDFAAGKVSSDVAAFLQSHPGITYLAFQYGDLMAGVLPPLKAAGLLTHLKVICVDAGTTPVLKGLIAGQVAASGVSGDQVVPWWAMDFIARYFEHMNLKTSFDPTASGINPGANGEGAQIASPRWIVDNAATAQPMANNVYGYAGPPNFQAQFEKLWHIGA